MEPDTRVNSVGGIYCCIVWRSQNFNSPTSNTVSHFKIVPLWLFYLLHVSFTGNSAVHRLRRKASTVFSLTLRRVDLKGWSHERDMLAFLTRSIAQCQGPSNIRHWINDEFTAKMIVYPWRRAYFHTAVSRRVFLTLQYLRSRPFFNPTTRPGMKWDQILLLVLLFIEYCKGGRVIRLQSPLGDMENLLSTEKRIKDSFIKILCFVLFSKRRKKAMATIYHKRDNMSCSFLVLSVKRQRGGRCEKRRFIKIKQHTKSSKGFTWYWGALFPAICQSIV